MKRLSIVLVVTVLALGLFASRALANCEDPNSFAPQNVIGWNVTNADLASGFYHYDPLYISSPTALPVSSYFPLQGSPPTKVPQSYVDSVIDGWYWDRGPSCTLNNGGTVQVWHLHGTFNGHSDPDAAGCGHGCLQYRLRSDITPDITPQVLPGYTGIIGNVNYRGNYYSGSATCYFTSGICQADSVMPTTPLGVSADLRQTGDGFNLYFPQILNQNDNQTYSAYFSASSLNSFTLQHYWKNGGNKITPQTALLFSADSYRSKYVAKKFSDLYPSFAPYVSLATPTPASFSCPVSGTFNIFSTGPGSAGFQFTNCTDQSQSLNGNLGISYNGPNITLSALDLDINSNFQGSPINSHYKNTLLVGAYMSTSAGVYNYTGEMNGEVTASFNGNYAWYIYDSAQTSAVVDTTAHTITFKEFSGNVYLGAPGAGAWVTPAVINPYVDTTDLFPISGTTTLKKTVPDGTSLKNIWLNGSLNVQYNDIPVGTLPTQLSIMFYF